MKVHENQAEPLAPGPLNEEDTAAFEDWWSKLPGVETGFEKSLAEVSWQGALAHRDTQAEPVALPKFNCWSTSEGDSWFDHPADAQAIYERLGGFAKVGDEYELLAGWRSVTARYRIVSIDGDDFEVECVSHTHPDQPVQPITSAEDYLRGRYGAYRGHFAWRELEEAFNAGRQAQPVQPAGAQGEPVAITKLVGQFPGTLHIQPLVDLEPNVKLYTKPPAVAINEQLLEALCKMTALYDAMGCPRGPCRILADGAIAAAEAEKAKGGV